ncbi:MAG: inorganic phosphate transporter family protein [Chloroflexi bacterium]|jgi:PiT family inorganic phosphate transporter|nr:inorganic phosphate transporter family protein [Chloroflexota bacterium]NCA13750.1 anion permease [Pseudomonadota bacterium]
MVTTALWVAVGLIAVALIFDFTNGFHDAANSIATVVATKTLTPFQAVAMAAFFNFIVMFFITFKVAATIGKGIVDPGVVSLTVVFGCLAGAIVWNLITWWFGIPTSSSHALVGGLIGASLTATDGNTNVVLSGFYTLLMYIIGAPIIGYLLGVILNSVVRRIAPEETTTNTTVFRRLQLVSSALYSMGHGANDAQKTAGIIFLILVASNQLPKDGEPPMWAIASCFVVMGLGTLMGGWRIVDTMGRKLTHLNPRQGFAAETGGSMMLFVASSLGIPVSTTHTITGAIMGVGSSEPGQVVAWRKAAEIGVAWVLTIPASALMASLFYVAAMSMQG